MIGYLQFPSRQIGADKCARGACPGPISSGTYHEDKWTCKKQKRGIHIARLEHFSVTDVIATFQGRLSRNQSASPCRTFVQWPIQNMSSNPSFPVSIPMVSFTQLGDHFISHEIAYTPIYNPHFIWKFLWNSLHLRPTMPGIKCKVATKIAWRTPPPPSPSAPVLWWSTIRGTRPGKHTKNYGRSPFLIGKSTIKINYKWSFSIAMFNYQRVALLHFAAR